MLNMQKQLCQVDGFIYVNVVQLGDSWLPGMCAVVEHSKSTRHCVVLLVVVGSNKTMKIVFSDFAAVNGWTREAYEMW